MSAGAEYNVCLAETARVVRKRKLHEPDDTLSYWRSADPAERIAMVQQLRAEYHGWDDVTGPRLQRVHCVLSRS